jgi:dihydrofolate reductase
MSFGGPPSLPGMRNLIVSNIISLDGFFEGPDRDVMALPMDDAFNEHNAERLRNADTLLFGSTGYRLFEGFWPEVHENPQMSPVVREISRMNNAIDKLVVSDTLKPAPASPWHATTRLVKRADAHAALRELKRGPGKDILMFGSRTLWNDLLAADLVDELHFMIGAKVLGSGTPAFGVPCPQRLELLGTRAWPGSNNVLVRYRVGGR